MFKKAEHFGAFFLASIFAKRQPCFYLDTLYLSFISFLQFNFNVLNAFSSAVLFFTAFEKIKNKNLPPAPNFHKYSK